MSGINRTPWPKYSPTLVKDHFGHETWWPCYFDKFLLLDIVNISGGWPAKTVNYRLRSLAKQGDNALGIVHLSIRQWMLSHLSSALPSAAKKSHYQSKAFVCVSNNCADAVDRLLIQERCLLQQSEVLLYLPIMLCISILMILTSRLTSQTLILTIH